MADDGQDFRGFVQEFIDSDFGHIKSLHNVESILRKVEEDKKGLEDQLSTVSSEVPKKIEGAVQDAKNSVHHIKDITQQQTQITDDITRHLTQTQPIKEDLTQFTTQVEEAERYVQYIRWLTFFEETSNDIQQSVLVNSLGGAVNFFAEMFDICEVLQKSRCEKLVQFSNSTILFWHRILKDKLSSEFEEVVKQLGWPFLGVATHIPPRVPRPTHLELTFRLETLFEQLLKIQIPDTIGKRRSSQPCPGSDEADRPFLLPLQLLLKPLRKRFKFHFTGSKQTNALDKPEWYLTQILGWIRDHADFLDHHIQPLLNRAGYPHVEAKLEFTRGLLMLVADKLAQDMESLLYDEHLFSHTVDEVLLFDRELRGSYSYPASQPGVLHVLTVQDTFHRWITVERKFAVEKMDLLFSSETAWTSQYGDIEDVDDMKTGECAEGFMTLMLALTDRYKPLPSAANKLEFLDLQLELLDDFRIRLTQVMKSEAQDPLGSTFLSILNAVNYVISVLREWSETVFFLQLQYSRAEQYRVRASSDLPLPQDPDLSSLQGAVFDELITLFQLLRTDMLSVVSNLVFTEMKARSKDYKDEKWLGLPSDKEYISRAVSASACPLLLLLKDRLHLLQLQLAPALFCQVWQRLADIINLYIMEEIILTNHFNEGGAAQLQFDMTRNLFPLFGEYTPRPDNYFKDVKEACVLLNLKPGSAMLLQEMLNKALHGSKIDPNTEKESPEKVLMDMGVFKLSAQQAEKVLNLRANWATGKKGRA